MIVSVETGGIHDVTRAAAPVCRIDTVPHNQSDRSSERDPSAADLRARSANVPLVAEAEAGCSGRARRHRVIASRPSKVSFHR